MSDTKPPHFPGMYYDRRVPDIFPCQWETDFDKARADFDNAVVVNGIVKWKMGNFVPEGIMDIWKYLNLPFDYAKSKAARDADTAAFIKSYRKNDKKRKVSAEERFEMRAAFGPGETVVNVFSGRKHRT